MNTNKGSLRNLTLGQMMQLCDPKLRRIPKEILEEGMLRHYFGDKVIPAKQRLLKRAVDLVCEDPSSPNAADNLRKGRDYVFIMKETDSEAVGRALVKLREVEGQLTEGHAIAGDVTSTVQYLEKRLKEWGGQSPVFGPETSLFMDEAGAKPSDSVVRNLEEIKEIGRAPNSVMRNLEEIRENGRKQAMVESVPQRRKKITQELEGELFDNLLVSEEDAKVGSSGTDYLEQEFRSPGSEESGLFLLDESGIEVPEVSGSKVIESAEDISGLIEPAELPPDNEIERAKGLPARARHLDDKNCNKFLSAIVIERAKRSKLQYNKKDEEKNIPEVGFEFTENSMKVSFEDFGGWKIPQISIDIGDGFQLEYFCRSEADDEAGNQAGEVRIFHLKFKGDIVDQFVLYSGESISFNMKNGVSIRIEDGAERGATIEISGTQGLVSRLKENIQTEIPIHDTIQKPHVVLRKVPIKAAPAQTSDVKASQTQSTSHSTLFTLFSEAGENIIELDESDLEILNPEREDRTDREVTKVFRLREVLSLSVSDGERRMSVDAKMLVPLLQDGKSVHAVYIDKEEVPPALADLFPDGVWRYVLDEGKEYPQGIKPLDVMEINGARKLVFESAVPGSRALKQEGLYCEHTEEQGIVSVRKERFGATASDNSIVEAFIGLRLRGKYPNQ